MLHASIVDALLQQSSSGQSWICAKGDADRPQGLCILQRRGFGRWSSLGAGPHQVGSSMVGELGALKSLLRSLPGRATVLDLQCTDPDVMPVDLSQDAELDVVPGAHAVCIHLQADFDSWWSARPAALRDAVASDQAALVRRFARVDVRWIDSPDALASAVLRGAALDARPSAAPSSADAPGIGDAWAVWRQLANAQAAAAPDAGQMVVCELWGDAAQLASQVLWASPLGDVVLLEQTHAKSDGGFAPERLLLHATLQRAHPRWAGRRFELCSNVAGWLANWADQPRHLRNISVFRHPSLRAMRHALQIGSGGNGSLSIEVAVEGDRRPLICGLHARLHDLPAGALALLREAERESLQLGPAWLGVLERAVFSSGLPGQAPGPDPLYAVLSQGDETLAVWPLAVRHSGPPQVEALANYYCAITGPVLQPWCRPQQLAYLIRHLARTVPQAQVLRLQPLDPQQYATQTLRTALRMAGYGVSDFFVFHNWVWRGAPDWPGYFAERSANLRSTARRSAKRLAEAGGRIEIITEEQDVARGMDAYEAVYARSWKQPEPFPMFFREVGAAAAQRKQLRLGVAWLGDEPIAAQFWTVAHGVVEIHKLAYDEAHKALGAGTALSAALFERVLSADQARTIDYLIGDDSYKAHWMNQRQQRWGMVAGRLSRPRGAWVVLSQMVRRAGKSWLASVRRIRTPQTQP